MAVAPGHIEERQLQEAAEAISGTVRETPVLSAGELSRRVGTRVRLKAENLQVTGSFKARGATNSIRQLSDEELAARRGGRERGQPRAGGGLRGARPPARRRCS